MATPGSTSSITGQESQKSSHFSSREELQAQADQMQQQMTDRVVEQPLAAVLISFGVGFGLGMLLSRAFHHPEPKTHWYDRKSAEQLGRRLLDSMAGMVPESVSKRLHY
jgi:hypothetical protein